MLKRVLALTVVLAALAGIVPALQTPAQAATASTYYIEVDIANQIVTVYRAKDNLVVRQMLCSSGRNGRTPIGTFKLAPTRSYSDRKEWYHISSVYWVQYATRIIGPYLFHSIPYRSPSLSNPDKTGLARFGRPASAGCVRLMWWDAKWIARNCPDGTTVRIFKNGASKSKLYNLLKAEGYAKESGLSYKDFIASTYKTSAAGALGRGASGKAVKRLQNRLYELGFFNTAINSAYDNATIAAVLRYQRAAGIKANGIASKALIERIMTDDSVIGPLRTLSSGVTGPTVTRLQQALTALGFYDGPIDGVYSAALGKSVKSYCLYNGLTAGTTATPAVQKSAYALEKKLDDQFGPGNYAVLKKSKAVTAAAARKTPLYLSAAADSAALATLAKGKKVNLIERGDAWSLVSCGGKTGYVPNAALTVSQITAYKAYWGIPADSVGAAELSSVNLGAGVEALQDRLRALGFYAGESTALYDARTIGAVEAWQAAAGLPVTGAISVEQQSALFGGDNVTGTAVTQAPGASNPAVAALQRVLRSLQYYKGRATGDYDAATARAVRLFARANGLGDSDIASIAVQEAALRQYLDCEAEYGHNGYRLAIIEAGAPMARLIRNDALRESPSRVSRAIAWLERDARAVVLSRSQRLTQVRVGGLTGYVDNDSLVFYAQERAAAVFEPIQGGTNGQLIYGTEPVLSGSAPEDPANAEAPDAGAAPDPGFTGLVVEEVPVEAECEDIPLEESAPDEGSAAPDGADEAKAADPEDESADGPEALTPAA